MSDADNGITNGLPTNSIRSKTENSQAKSSGKASNIANSENGRLFYDITNIEEASDYTRKYAAPLAQSSSAFGNLSNGSITNNVGKSQAKSSGKASKEVKKGEAAGAYTAVREAGYEPVAIRGELHIRNGIANAYVENGRIYFRTDARDASGRAISPRRLVEHEIFHMRATEQVLLMADSIIRERMTSEEYDAMREVYKSAYASIYDYESMSVEEIEALITEEVAADAYAGINYFAENGETESAVREATEKSAPAQSTETQETRGPPEGRGAIVTLPDGKKYVKADRQVIFGNDPDSWGDQIEGYINRKIRNGEDVILTTDSGDVLRITRDTAGKASFRNYVTDERGRRRLMTDSEYEAKLNAEAHIDELARASERINKNARPDETATDGRPVHGRFAENGWIYREAWFQDFDNQHYRVTLSVADGNKGVVVYNVGKMEKRTSPARKHGPSVPVSENGAQQGKSSSEENISSNEEKSQAKSSGRSRSI